jgi:urease accessory protein
LNAVNSTLASPLQEGRWQAELALELTRTVRGTRLTRCRHHGPLYVQKPFYPEGPDWAHIYPLHPPGGLVSGDQLDISVLAAAETGVLLTTPGAARMYRARCGGPRQQQNTRLRVAADAAMEWFPLETIVFDGAEVDINTNIELEPGARLAAWEINCFGRPASGEVFLRGSFRQRYRISCGGRPVFIDQMVVDARHRQLLQSLAGLQGSPVNGFFVMGPFNHGPLAQTQPEKDSEASLMQSLRNEIDAHGLCPKAAISRVGELYVGRYLGGSAEQARKLFVSWWRLLRPGLMGRSASEPRIWYT